MEPQPAEAGVGETEAGGTSSGTLRLPTAAAYRSGGTGISQIGHNSNYSTGRGSEDVDSLTYSQDGSSVRIKRDGTGTSSMRSGMGGGGSNVALTPSDSPLLNNANSPSHEAGRAASMTSASVGVGVNGDPLTVGSTTEEAGGLGKKAERSLSDDENGFDDDDWDDEVLYYGKNDKVRDDKDAATSKPACCACTIM